uniref:Cullin-2 n=1 Tax=Crassostrea virginica TaxID=6565 RepID=A0A8B8C0L7_CRAVI|nr:LOW QUALITY PROTEIN: cullin-2-like [Crassostrea virginica]
MCYISFNCFLLIDLSNMYKLLKPIHGGLGVLIQEVEGHIKQTGLEAVKSLKGDNVPGQFVESMLEVHQKYTELIQGVFHSDQQFVGALDKACAAAINFKQSAKHLCKSPEMLSKYCDNLLKKSSKGVSESELDDKLSNCITVFKYLDDKDVFQRFYSRMLAKRLIYGQSASMDAEEAMINKLKQACGYEFTNKLHRMFTDVSISTSLNKEFLDFIQSKENVELGVNFSIMVLQAGAWPIGQSNLPSFSITQELEKSVQMFEAFYNVKYSGRKLTWLHNFCSAELKFNHLKRPYFVTMGSFQMAILLLFNSSDILTFHDIRENTNLPEKELLKQLQTLIDTKIVSTEGEVTSCSCISLNLGYTNKRTKFKITTAIQKDSSQEVEQTHNAVEEDRKMYLQAAIVRIMKARKILKHAMLIQEVISQSRARFAPSVPMIKKCIESLIDKSYLERTANSSDEYSYIA